MLNIDMEAFEEKYQSARMYHYRANQFLEEGQAASVIFNVASVALENYLIALCELYGVDPGNHNYACLMDAVGTILAVPPELDKGIRSLDLIYGICSLENFHLGITQETDADRVLVMCRQVENLFDPARLDLARKGLLQQ